MNRILGGLLVLSLLLLAVREVQNNRRLQAAKEERDLILSELDQCQRDRSHLIRVVVENSKALEDATEQLADLFANRVPRDDVVALLGAVSEALALSGMSERELAGAVGKAAAARIYYWTPSEEWPTGGEACDDIVQEAVRPRHTGVGCSIPMWTAIRGQSLFTLWSVGGDKFHYYTSAFCSEAEEKWWLSLLGLLKRLDE